jgi:hypothetical protein
MTVSEDFLQIHASDNACVCGWVPYSIMSSTSDLPPLPPSLTLLSLPFVFFDPQRKDGRMPTSWIGKLRFTQVTLER